MGKIEGKYKYKGTDLAEELAYFGDTANEDGYVTEQGPFNGVQYKPAIHYAKYNDIYHKESMRGGYYSDIMTRFRIAGNVIGSNCPALAGRYPLCKDNYIDIYFSGHNQSSLNGTSIDVVTIINNSLSKLRDDVRIDAHGTADINNLPDIICIEMVGAGGAGGYKSTGLLNKYCSGSGGAGAYACFYVDLSSRYDYKLCLGEKGKCSTSGSGDDSYTHGYNLNGGDGGDTKIMYKRSIYSYTAFVNCHGGEGGTHSSAKMTASGGEGGDFYINGSATQEAKNAFNVLFAITGGGGTGEVATDKKPEQHAAGYPGNEVNSSDSIVYGNPGGNNSTYESIDSSIESWIPDLSGGHYRRYINRIPGGSQVPMPPIGTKWSYSQETFGGLSYMSDYGSGGKGAGFSGQDNSYGTEGQDGFIRIWI